MLTHRPPISLNRLHDYLEQLPQALDSFPECRAKGSVIMADDRISPLLECSGHTMLRLDHNDGAPGSNARSGGALGPCP